MNHWERKATLSISENCLSFQKKRQEYCGTYSTQIFVSLSLVIIILNILDLTFYTLPYILDIIKKNNYVYVGFNV